MTKKETPTISKLIERANGGNITKNVIYYKKILSSKYGSSKYPQNEIERMFGSLFISCLLTLFYNKSDFLSLFTVWFGELKKQLISQNLS